MPRLLWLLLQGVVIGAALLIDWQDARTTGRPPAPGLALLLGITAALILSAAIARILDAYRHGWKTSEPAGAMATTMRAALLIASLVSSAFGLGLLFGNGSTAETRWPGMILLAAGVAAVVAAALWSWTARKRSPVRVAVGSPNGRPLGFAGDIGKPDEAESGISARRRIGREQPKTI
jgi:hypothetical protein